MKITIETTVDAPLEAVWRAWVTPADIRAWNCASEDWCCPAAELELKPGGRFSYRMEARDGSMGFDFAGTFTRIVDGRSIEYEIDDERSVSVEFIPVRRGTLVRESFDAESEHSEDEQRQGWQSILDRFARHVEGGG